MDASKVSKVKGMLDGPTLVVVIVMWILGVATFFHSGTVGSAIMATVLFSVLCLPAAIVGNSVRKAITPMFVLTSGVWNLIKVKIFWTFGIQAIAVFIAMAISFSLINSKDVIAREKARAERSEENAKSAERQKKADAEAAVADKALMAKIQAEAETITSADWLKGGLEEGKYYRIKSIRGVFGIGHYNKDYERLDCSYNNEHVNSYKWPFRVDYNNKLLVNAFGKEFVISRKQFSAGNTISIPLTPAELSEIQGDRPDPSAIPHTVEVIAKYPNVYITMLTITKK